jgi:very-short-patch-repair endonuclease
LAGFKFRRQHPLGGFVVDFFCERARLAIELDGGGHAEKEQAAYDTRRTERLGEMGVRVLRFWNLDVMTNLDGVVEVILKEIERTPPSP